MVRAQALLAVAAAGRALAQQAGSFDQVGDTLVSGMMMFLGNEEKVYIMDKVEGNAAQINGHPAWASVWDIQSKKATAMDFMSNAFCASGASYPNGSFITFGGNGAVGPSGALGSDPYPGNFSAIFDKTYDDYDGTKAIRVLNPCTGDPSSWPASCQWFDNATVLSMQKSRWYSTAESLADGSVVLLGGFVNGGYINRNYPNKDCNSGGAAENTFEYWPPRGAPEYMPFLCNTSGLNSYAHAFLMPSGNMFVQANYSSMLWNYTTNVETPLPDMPGQVVRVYPASGGAAMLPLTPANNYEPTILFCGGATLSDAQWGDYSYPNANTWDIPASRDCQRIAPEPQDGSGAAYVQDDDMLDPRTMGQFIILPTGKLLMINGARNGTAGYSNVTHVSPTTPNPYAWSLAADAVLTPALYDPAAPAGQRWSNAGFGAAQFPRLYHSTALLLPDGSVMVAGGNPNVDVATDVPFPTTYTAEYFYPPYWNASRPAPTGMPKNISYGGAPFDITVPASSYSGAANDAAANTTVVLLRPGWSTHAMNMGQRYVQLNSTYSVQSDGSYVLHTAQAPPNPNLLTPGPALLFVVVNGVPSNGTMVTVGNGEIGPQPVSDAAQLPASVTDASAKGSGSGSGSASSSGSAAGSQSTGKSGAAGRGASAWTAAFAVFVVAIAFF